MNLLTVFISPKKIWITADQSFLDQDAS